MGVGSDLPCGDRTVSPEGVGGGDRGNNLSLDKATRGSYLPGLVRRVLGSGEDIS